MEGRSKLRFGRKEAHDTGDHVTPFRGQKVKVSKLLNAVTESQPYLLNRKAYEL